MGNINEEGEINPILLEFLDADCFEDKYKILVATPNMDFDNLLIPVALGGLACMMGIS